MYLLSQYGERHEDRIPEGIFSSLDKIVNYLTKYASNEDEGDFFIDDTVVETDYDHSAIEFVILYISKDKFEELVENDKATILCDVFIVEKWKLDTNEKEKESKFEEILPIENFKDPQVRNNLKCSIIRSIELAQETNIRGIAPFVLRDWLGTGSESQIRELLSELEKSGLIISTGSTRDKKYSIAGLAEEAKAEYEKECDERRLQWKQ